MNDNIIQLTESCEIILNGESITEAFDRISEIESVSVALVSDGELSIVEGENEYIVEYATVEDMAGDEETVPAIVLSIKNPTVSTLYQR